MLTLMQEASAEIKTVAQEGKCWDAVEKEFKMEKYASLPRLSERPRHRGAALLRPVGPRHLSLTDDPRDFGCPASRRAFRLAPLSARAAIPHASTSKANAGVACRRLG